jgi:uncharacterized protein (DUF1499 family)
MARMVWGIGIVVAVSALLAGMLVMTGALERVWTLFGPADLGPVAFETLERRSVPNDALICPEGLCRAASDETPPVFGVSADALRVAMGRVIATEPDVTQVERSSTGERYIQRTKWMRFPDTVVVRYIPLGAERSTIALYSRSQLGKGDLGVNKARIQRWLDKLSREAPVAR